MADLPLAIAPHPIGGIPAETASAKADALFETVIAGLTGPQPDTST